MSTFITNILKLNKLENQQIYPNVQRYDLGEQLCECMLSFENDWDKKGIAFFLSCNCMEGSVIEVWQQGAAEKLLGKCNVKYTKDHSWRSYRMFTFPLENLEADLIDLKLVIKLNGSGSCKLDYFKFYK